MNKNNYATKINECQLELPIMKSDNSSVNGAVKAKRIDIVSIKLVKESSILYKNRKISSPSDAASIGMELLKDCDREHLIVCCLDTKNQPTAINTVSIGSLNSSIVHPREVFKSAILSNAASIILYHNHPSGVPAPSPEDISITTRIKECGKILGIDLLDHIIIGEGSFVSIKERGLI